MKDVSDLALSRSIADVQGMTGNLAGSSLGAKQCRTHLRAVPMREDEAIPGRAETHNFCCRAAGIRHLLGNTSLLTRTDEGIAADGKKNGLHCSS